MNRNSAITSLIWRFLERMGAQLVSFGISIVLARLLDPTVYGTIALVTVFISIMQVFVDSGFGTALIQKKDADDLDFSTVFYFNIVICCLLYVVMYFLAPFIGRFYGNEELVPVIRVLSLTLVISGVRNVQQAYVSRHLLFKKFFFSTIGGTLCAAVVGIGMAYRGYGVWALVGQQLVNTLMGTIILWFVVKWRPKWMFSFSRLKALFKYGWKLLMSALIDTIYSDVRQLIIGKLYSTDDLAYYNKGDQFPKLMATNTNAAIDSVLLPTMSQEQENHIRVKSMTRRAIKTSTYVVAPVMIGLAVCAEPIIRLLLTEKWLDCVPFMQIFCITYMLYPVHTANLNAIKAIGRSDVFLKLEIVKKIMGMAVLVSTMFISVKAMAYGLLLNTLFSTIINAFPNKKLLGYSWKEQMKDILPNVLIAVGMGVPVYLLQNLSLPTAVTLVLQCVSGVMIYIVLSILLKLETFHYLLGIIRGLSNRRK